MPTPELATTPSGPPGTSSELGSTPFGAHDVAEVARLEAGPRGLEGADGPVREARGALDLLRLPGRPRLTVEPGLVDHVRSRLVAALGPASRSPEELDRREPSHRGPAGPAPAAVALPRTVLTRSVVNQALACPAHGTVPVAANRSSDEIDTALVRAALVRALFRQLVTVGSIGDPLADGLEALEADPSRAPLARWVRALPRDRRDLLARDVARHARQLASHWCPPAPAWLPRTAVRLRATLGTSGFELAGHVDLVVGEPSPDRASVALVSLRTGDRSPVHELDRRLAALAHTLSQGVPPFAVATFYSATGTLAVEAVDLAMLERAGDRVAAAARRVVGEHQPDDDATRSEDARCPWCGDPPASRSGLSDSVARPGGQLAGGVAGYRRGAGNDLAAAQQANPLAQPTGRVGGQHRAGQHAAGALEPPSSPHRSCRRHHQR